VTYITATTTEDLGAGSFGSTSEFSAAVCTDSDGDGLWDCEEDWNRDGDGNPATDPGPDTDGDTIPNYLDPDDDGDGIPTASENADPNGDGDPRDAVDTDRDGQPDYLDPFTVATRGWVRAHQKISDTEGGFTPTLDDADFFGSAVVAIGDLDGDGVVDLAVGAENDDDGGTDKGAVYILFMNSDGTVSTTQKISQASGNGPALDVSDRFGSAIANLGDLNGDGRNELMVGAPGDDDGASNTGAVYVLFLNADGTVAANQKISDTAGGLVASAGSASEFGWSAAGIGDVNGDGIPDALVGTPFFGSGGTSDRGRAYVLFLDETGSVIAETALGSGVGGMPALDNLDYFGGATAGLGDIDADGIPDVAVGAYGDDDGAAGAGAVYVLRLNANGTAKAVQKLSQGTGGMSGLAAGDGFGWTAAGVGDLDLDGVPDLFVGATYDDDGGTDRGAGYVLNLNSTGTAKAVSAISDIAGNFTATIEDSDWLGDAVAGVGDLDGDGSIDLVITADGDDDGGTNRGAVYVLFLEATGVVTVNSTGDAADASAGDGVCDTGGSNSTGADECTLRAAIQEANASVLVDTIHFAIPTSDPGYGTGWWTISPTTALPNITDTVDLDATTQTGWASWSPVVQVDASALAAVAAGVRLDPGAVGSRVAGLAITGSPGIGLDIQSADTTIEDNLIGLDPSGTAGPGNVENGLHLNNAANSIVRRNASALNGGDGIRVQQASISVALTDNRVGTSADGVTVLGNSGQGITVAFGATAHIGAPGAGNIIVGSGGDGIHVGFDGARAVIQANTIGETITGAAAPNSARGVGVRPDATAVVGGTGPGEGNIIVNSGSAAIATTDPMPDAATSDTDGDGIPNELDPDDDGDGIPTALENADPNGDGDPRDALDSDRDGQPDYLDAPTAPPAAPSPPNRRSAIWPAV
jgi:CSLREA domain-containing protein